LPFQRGMDRITEELPQVAHVDRRVARHAAFLCIVLGSQRLRLLTDLASPRVPAGAVETNGSRAGFSRTTSRVLRTSARTGTMRDRFDGSAA
jgi:hypothetical protein